MNKNNNDNKIFILSPYPLTLHTDWKNMDLYGNITWWIIQKRHIPTKLLKGTI